MTWRERGTDSRRERENKREIERERERQKERERERERQKRRERETDIYIYIERERERARKRVTAGLVDMDHSWGEDGLCHVASTERYQTYQCSGGFSFQRLHFLCAIPRQCARFYCRSLGS